MPIIIFVRHGQSGTNTTNILNEEPGKFPLTPLGERQVLETAKQLSRVDIERIYTSPVLRAKQTAEILGNGRGLDIKVDARLSERHFGALADSEAVPKALGGEMISKGGDWRINAMGKSIDGLEEFHEVEARANSFLKSVSRMAGITLAVSHMDTIDALLTYKLGMDDVSGFGMKVSNASMTVVYSNAGEFKLLSFGTLVLTDSLLSMGLVENL